MVVAPTFYVIPGTLVESVIAGNRNQVFAAVENEFIPNLPEGAARRNLNPTDRSVHIKDLSLYIR